MGSFPGRIYPSSQATPKLSPDCQSTVDIMNAEKATVNVGFRASLPSTPRLLSSRPCEQAQARLGLASIDRVSLPVTGTEGQKVTGRLCIPTTNLLYSKCNSINKQTRGGWQKEPQKIPRETRMGPRLSWTMPRLRGKAMGSIAIVPWTYQEPQDMTDHPILVYV